MENENMELVELAELTEGPVQGETQELTETPDSFLVKSFDDYTVTEGLLLVIFVTLVLALLGRFLGRCTSWL